MMCRDAWANPHGEIMVNYGLLGVLVLDMLQLCLLPCLKCIMEAVQGVVQERVRGARPVLI